MELATYFYLLYISVFSILNVSILANFLSSLQPSCSHHDRLALLHFKHSFQIDCASSPSPSLPHPKVKSWTQSGKEDCCSWEGVECDQETGQVIGLDLSNSCLHGPLPHNSSIFGLSHLIDLNLAFNHFNYSQIPTQFGHFYKLQSLNLSNSAFSGQIPSNISKLSELILLDLSNIYVSTYSTLNLKLHDPSIDMLVQNLTSLQILKLDAVDMSSNFPTVLSNLSSLKELTLGLCNLYGELPQNIFRLPHLQVLNLNGNNNLGGFLPEFQWHCPLKILYLSFTALSGEVPHSIGKLPHLEILVLDDCQFSGMLPSSLSNRTTLTQLILDGNNFQGDIPFSFMNLTNLEILGLSNLNVKPGQLFSQLPKRQALIGLGLSEMKNLDSEILSLLANFTRLQVLFLENTNLKGPFPDWLANLTQLYMLRLSDNELTGLIPQWISQLSNLHYIHLKGNNLFGKFETFLKLKNLIFLELSGNNIIFTPISRNNDYLTHLDFLGLSGCNLSEFPQFLQFHNRLQFLSLANNNISGSIPQWFVAITKDSLLYIDLSSNNLTGFEKSEVVLPWNNLEYIDLSSNRFRGLLPIPPDFMKIYLVSFNMFTGDIPNEICNAKSIISLDLSNNMLSGNIPHCIANQLGDSLEMLDLRSNKLTGTIPPEFTRSCKVKMINLSNNELVGDLPKSLINCSMLEVLDIGRNRFIGTFPTWLSSLPRLQVLVLNHNSFHGRIPDPESGYSFRLLRIIDLSYNLHSGDLPSGYLQNWHEMKDSKENQSDTSYIKVSTYLQVGLYGYLYNRKLDYSITITNKGNERLYTTILKVLRVVDFSSNNFTGRIPDIIGNLQGLQALNLSNNNLHGRIPPSLANISDLESLDLSQNMLSGEIPLALPGLKFLEVLNVSHNELEGQIPTGNQFNTFDNSSFQGNLGLCGMPLTKSCTNSDAPQSPPHTVANEDSELINWIIRSFGFLSGCIVGYVIGKLYITDKYHEWFMETFGRQRPRRIVPTAPRQMVEMMLR